KKISEEKDVACSISGGKDSTATLLLMLDAGVKPKLLFTDTGLEFDETIEMVHRIAEEYGLELLERGARTDFFDDLKIFGNSSRDYRWCCKTRKMAPMSYLINGNFSDGVLTFIGQRRYESQNRERHGAVWVNPWLKKQLSASPIQNWNSMEVWLYLFSKNAHYNPLYELGFERIGCWLCPASDLYDFELYKHKDYERYIEYLREHYNEEAIHLGLWRFRKKPRWYDGEVERKAKQDVAFVDEGSRIRFFAPEERVKNLGKALGIELVGSEIHVKDEREKEDIRKIIYKAKYCAGCGLCESACENNAIYIDIKEKRARIKEELCTSCGACLSSLCPAVEYPG
ncbi:MAG: phosphoadenosine phosphosulfate reductase family protein, partial [Candidatus Thermoplasmatota archaeon]|nr:phosphoadenosine phosphosulfate reductase family protein [Candidatus Thermoplasmatota archaeon]